MNTPTKKNLFFKSYDLYSDANPKDTIRIKYATLDDVKNTIKKLERLYKAKKYSHKRISQVAMILKVRLEAMKKHNKSLYPNAKNVNERYNLANKYFKLKLKFCLCQANVFDSRSYVNPINSPFSLIIHTIVVG